MGVIGHIDRTLNIVGIKRTKTQDEFVIYTASRFLPKIADIVEVKVCIKNQEALRTILHKLAHQENGRFVGWKVTHADNSVTWIANSFT